VTAVVGVRERLAEVAPGDWDELLRELGCADAYLTRPYVEASAILDPGEPILLHLSSAGGAVVFAAIVREIPGASGFVDVTTPYGYGGPVAAGAAPQVAEFWELYERWCGERRAVTTFFRFHPLWENADLAPAELPRRRVANTATWRLDADADLLAGMHSMHRRGARKAERAGVAVTFTRGPEDLDEFVALYEAAMRRVEADAYYLFARPYWDALTGLGRRLVRVDASLEGRLLASQLHLANDGGPPWLHYHLGAASDRGFELGASKLLFLRVAEWGREHGFSELHLGSGLGGREDSLWQFKQRFSPHPGRPFWLGHAVHDADAYRELAGTDGTDGFFPAYRAPA
jgi:serine/alanine adding enzyme